MHIILSSLIIVKHTNTEKYPHLTYTSVKWLFSLKSELRKSFLATYVQISSELY